ncbi:50S ribosomal protein L25 [Aerococcus urinaehominis]|uniref:Large ribosomal subunit protein bL25 n=1 Tax=Aerococcus urinaehominis TaxID=128944 RepID=A0A0X8FKQ9_9LACT|nr:50S ribosomal protein L25 [Aerococcus urinaehominis]AMB99027.1 50S ribosomal protein L25 [Aerococcus urinaehominis]SDM51307.1 large subunit ribosomal protein L25 [Aerococcus urinaehominis]
MKFTAKRRESKGTNAAKQIRKEDLVPATVYASDMEPINLTMARPDVEQIERELGINSVFELEIEGGDTRTVFIRTIERAAIKPIIYNVSLQAIKKGEKLEMPIAIVLENEEDVAGEGVATLNFFEVNVLIDPAKAPESISVDVAGMEIGDNVTVGDLNLPEGAELVDEADEVIISITTPTEEAELVEGDEEMPEPEVLNEEEGTFVEDQD